VPFDGIRQKRNGPAGGSAAGARIEFLITQFSLRSSSHDNSHQEIPGAMSGRGIFARLKGLFTLRRSGDSASHELGPYREEFAPNDPVLGEISEAIRARQADGRKESGKGSAAA
jgi:hypothetical protein